MTAHTEVSARSLAGTIRKICSNESMALVVAMATDKDHASFLRALISGGTAMNLWVFFHIHKNIPCLTELVFCEILHRSTTRCCLAYRS